MLLRAKGNADEAERLLREALDKRRKTLTDAHPDTLESFIDLGRLLAAKGKLGTAAFVAPNIPAANGSSQCGADYSGRASLFQRKVSNGLDYYPAPRVRRPNSGIARRRRLNDLLLPAQAAVTIKAGVCLA